MNKENFYNIKIMNKGYGKTYHELQHKIKTLLKENEELKKNQRYYKNGVFSLEYDKETLSDMIDDYKSRVEKAVEYITSYQKIKTVKVGDKHIVHCCLELIGDEYVKLLNILQNEKVGEEDE